MATSSAFIVQPNFLIKRNVFTVRFFTPARINRNFSCHRFNPFFVCGDASNFHTYKLTLTFISLSLSVSVLYKNIWIIIKKLVSFSLSVVHILLLLLLLLLTLQKQRVISDRRNHRLCSHPSSLAPRASSLSPTLSGSSCSPLFSCGTPPCFFSFGLRRLGC